jgi:hypothetical protein
MTTQHPPTSAPATYQANAFMSQDYVSVRSSDNIRMMSSSKGFPNYPFQYFRFTISEKGITYLNVHWEGYGWYSGFSVAHYQAYLYVWNNNNLNWELLGSNSTDIHPTDFVIKYNAFSNLNDYVDDSDHLHVMAQGPQVADNTTYSELYTDFIQVDTKATGIIFPTNPSLDVGDDGDIEWALSGIFDGMVTIDNNDDFKTELQSLVNLAAPGIGNVDIPLKFTSMSSGKIRISNISIQYGLNTPPYLPEPIPIDTFGFYEDTDGGDNLIDLNDYFWDDHDNGSLKYAILMNNEDIRAELDADGHHLDFTAAENYYGTLEFQVRAIDRGYDGIEGGDADLDTDSNVFEVTVWPTNDAPVLESVGGIDIYDFITQLEFKGAESAYEDEWWNISVVADDIDGDTLTFSINETLTTPAALDIAPDPTDPNVAQLSILATNEYVGFLFLNITVTDNNATGTREPNPSKGPLTDSIDLKLEVVNTNDHPTLDPLSDQIVDEDSWLNFTITASDDDIIHGERLKFSTNLTDAIDGLDKGENYEFDKETGEVSILPDNEMVGTYWVNFEVEDLAESLDSQTVKIIVNNVNDAPVPVISSPLNQQVFNTTTRLYFDAGNSTDDDFIHGDSLEYQWRSDLFGTLGNSESFEMILTDTGWHNITLKVTDKSKAEVETVISVKIATAAVVDDGGIGDGIDDGTGTQGEISTEEDTSGIFLGIIIMVIVIIIIVLVGILLFIWRRNKTLRELERELEEEDSKLSPPLGVIAPPQMMAQQPIMQQSPLPPIQPPQGMGVPQQQLQPYPPIQPPPMVPPQHLQPYQPIQPPRPPYQP